jgi:putative spermidine/putrescine transport system permease protein
VTPGIGIRVLTLLMALVFVFPTIVVIGTSFNADPFVVFPPTHWGTNWYGDVFKNEEWVAALWSSLKVGLIAGVLSMVVGALMAFAATRGRLIPSSVITTLAMLPIIVPTVVAGLGFYIVTAHIHLAANALALGLAHATLGVPFVFVNVLAALTTIDPRVEEAARISGANELVTMLRVTVPLILPATIVGGVLSFISSWDEVIVSGFLTSPTFRTIPVEIYGSVRDGATPATSAVATMVTVVSLLMLGGVALATASGSKKSRRQTS